MTRIFGTLPVALKISALSVGVPLVVFGLGSMVSDLTRILHAGSFTAGSHVGLELGPIFAVVGMSFLWPLRSFHSQNR